MSLCYPIIHNLYHSLQSIIILVVRTLRPAHKWNSKPEEVIRIDHSSEPLSIERWYDYTFTQISYVRQVAELIVVFFALHLFERSLLHCLNSL
jgi:hypothetical protein